MIKMNWRQKGGGWGLAGTGRMWHSRAEDAVDCDLEASASNQLSVFGQITPSGTQFPPLEKSSNHAKEMEGGNGWFQGDPPRM